MTRCALHGREQCQEAPCLDRRVERANRHKPASNMQTYSSCRFFLNGKLIGDVSDVEIEMGVRR